MLLDHYSLIIIVLLLNFTIRTTMAITGCIVTLVNSNSIRRKVLCADPKTQIEAIPIGLPETTDVLTISYQNISTIEERELETLFEMKRFFLTFSHLRKIHKNAFKLLSHLIVLDLSDNFLTISEDSLPVEILLNLSELQYLKLSGNPLTMIPDLIFKPLSLSLRKLYINRCNNPSLKISPRAFKGLNNLEELDLSESGVTTLLQPMESDLREMKLLKLFLIGENNFYCDCKLRWFYFYLTEIQETVTLFKDIDKFARCSGPGKLTNVRFPAKDDRNHLRFIDFTCISKCMSNNSRDIIVKSGASVNFTCECFTDPIQRLVWTKNGHAVEESNNKYKITHSGKETFYSTLSILSLQPVDSGNYSCKIDLDAIQNFTLKIKSNPLFSSAASINIYILVGLGSSLFLISLIVVMVVMFCRRETLCQFRNQHPMVICGYETNIRKSSLSDGDLQFRYNQQDGRFNTSFYENTIPFDSSLSHYHRSNHLFPEEIFTEKNYVTKAIDLSTFPKSNNEKMLNVYCGCHYNSDEDPENQMIRSSYSTRTRSSKPFIDENNSYKPTKLLNSEEKFQQLKLKTATEIEKLIPNLKQCPFHGSSGTLTRIPGEKPCPVHGSTATLPSRLSSRKVEHRFGCPKHNKDNISVKSLKLESTTTDHVKPHRSKSVNRLPIKLDVSTEKVEIMTSKGYRPCPLHGDVLAAINENIFEPINNTNGVQLKSKLHLKTHSKNLHEKPLKIPLTGCERSGKKSLENLKSRGDQFQEISVSISHTLTSPVQSSLSSSPLLTSDVHGTLV